MNNLQEKVCPCCKADISDSADICPICHNPLTIRKNNAEESVALLSNKQQEQQVPNMLYMLLATAAVISIGLFAYFLFNQT